MRLLFVSTLYPNHLEPTRATFNRGLLGAIAGLGHEVRVVAPIVTFPGERLVRFRREWPRRHETIDGIEVFHPSFHRTPGCLVPLHHHFYRWSVAATVRRMIETGAPDHVMLGFAYPDAAAIAPLCRELGVDWSIRLNGSDFYVRGAQKRFAGTVMGVLRAAPRLFCPGEAMAAALTEAGLDQRQITWFHNGVDHRTFHPPAPFREEHRVALFVGNLLPVKGADRLLPAWRLLHESMAGNRLRDEPPWELHIVGDGPLRRKMERESLPRDLQDSVKFLGRLPHAEIATQMRHAHCLVLPSRSEGMPNVVVEALACGTPVVGTDAGEIPYLVKNGRNGYVVPGKTENLEWSLASALRKTLDRRWDRHAISRPIGAYTWEHAAERCVDAIAAGRRRDA